MKRGFLTKELPPLQGLIDSVCEDASDPLPRLTDSSCEDDSDRYISLNIVHELILINDALQF